jgi:hypothetical protein
MNYKNMNRLFALASFILASAVYLMTVQPGVPFWDCGEFSGASIWQQVPHPPGAPLFLLLGKVFHLAIPFGDPGWRINLLAVFSSSVTVFLLYLITVKVIENFNGKPNSIGSAIATYSSGFIAAAALTFSDTFWFNAVESEVYATSTLFVALITYLMMRWNAKAEEHRSEKYLLLIFYLIGLSTGVHLLAILTIFSVYTIVFFRKYDMKTTKNYWGKFIGMGILAVFTFFIIYPFVIKYIPAFLAGHTSGRNNFGEYAVTGSTGLQALAIIIILLAIAGFAYSVIKKNKVLSFITTSFLLIIMGYTSYTQILIRSNSNPPMNENEPKDFNSLASYLGREQYGNAPTFQRRYQQEPRFTQRYQQRDADGEYVYGEWFAPDFNYQTGEYVWDSRNKAGDWQYLLKYQAGHMYWRYFGWNFVGRVSDVQDAGVAWFQTPPDHYYWNHESSYITEFPIKFYALPLILGLFGMFFHFYRDPKRALAFMFLFLLTGILSALSQNQQDPQPRERDYFYAASFFVWAMWVGMGVISLTSMFKERELKIASPVIALICLIAVPLNMAAGGWKIHSRAGNHLPFDYSYNILQSCEENAILFTNGDNDTFPVWYIQDVMGVRRDVRVVNLSLGNTPWYIDQLKNRQPWGAEKLPLSFPDESIQCDEYSQEAIAPFESKSALPVTIPVKKEVLAQYTDDSATIARGEMRFTWLGSERGNGRQRYYVNHQLVRNIMENVRFERPVYFSTTVGPDVFSGLQNFLRLEGMAWKVCPVIQGTGYADEINPDVMKQCLLNTDNTDNFSKEHKYGFKFRNLNNQEVYYDEVHRRLMDSYRHLYYVFAVYATDNLKDTALAVEVLDKMNENISLTQFPIDYNMAYRLARLYQDCGADAQAAQVAEIGIERCNMLFEHPELDQDALTREIMGSRQIGPYRAAAMMYEIKHDYEGAASVLQTLQPKIEEYYNSLEKYYGKNQSNEFRQQEMMLRRTLIGLDFEIELMQLKKVKHEEGTEAAVKFADTMVQNYLDKNERLDSNYARGLEFQINDLKNQWGVKTETVTEELPQ